jgi:hypothetical protein
MPHLSSVPIARRWWIGVLRKRVSFQRPQNRGAHAAGQELTPIHKVPLLSKYADKIINLPAELYSGESSSNAGVDSTPVLVRRLAFGKPARSSVRSADTLRQYGALALRRVF